MREALEASLEATDIWLLVFTGIVAIGVVGEGVFGVRHWLLSRKLRVVLETEEAVRRIEIANVTERANNAERDTEILRQSNLVLQADLLKLRKESEPRRLTGGQEDILRSRLEGHSTRIAVVSCIMDPESKDLADDFVSALTTAHWECFRIINRISSNYGVSVGMVHNNPIAVPEVKLLSDALTEIKVPHNIVPFSEGDASTSPAFQAHILYLVIEHKPPLEFSSPAK
jgi:hypothetical protein